MIAQVRKCLKFLSPRMRLRWALLIPLAIVAAVMEALGAAAVFFLIKIVSDPSRLFELPIVSAIFSSLPWRDDKAAVQFLTGLTALLYLVKNVLLGVVAYAQRNVVSESV